MEITWFPPSWLLIKTAGKIIYIDPAWVQTNFVSYPKHIVFSHYPDPMDGLPEPDLPLADIILVTHHHQDHIKSATIERLSKPSTKIFAPAKCARFIYRDFTVVFPKSTIQLDETTSLQITHAYNTSTGRSTIKQHKRGECVGYVLESAGKRLYHAGDTDVIPEMNGLGPIDAAFLPVGGTYTMDSEEAVAATVIISPAIVIPMHFLHADPADFIRDASTLPSTTARQLAIGDTLVI